MQGIWHSTSLAFATGLALFIWQQEESEPRIQIESAAEARELDETLESVTVDLQDRETLAALAEQVPGLRSLELIYYPNGAMPEGSVAELEKFRNLQSLVFRGDPVVTPEEIAIIGQLVTLRKLKLALP
ncbi:MAG: hypothetical protein ACR2NP_14600 [Pirellulaceae bacterium]